MSMLVSGSVHDKTLRYFVDVLKGCPFSLDEVHDQLLCQLPVEG